MSDTPHKNAHLSPRACLALGGTAGAVGLAASGVATWFYVLGLIELEPSGTARTALIAAGVLLTIGQLAAFGIAAAARGKLLPGLRRTLLALGTALFLFETGSMALTQMALVQSADVAAGAAAARVAELQHAIEARRATAARQRDLAETQAQAQAITAAARSLRAAEASEATIEPLAAELAQLQAARRPTLSTLLGSEQNVALFATTRAALIALVGLVMTSTAGALFRDTRGTSVAAEIPTHLRNTTSVRQRPGRHTVTGVPLPVPDDMPQPVIPQRPPETRAQNGVPLSSKDGLSGQVQEAPGPCRRLHTASEGREPRRDRHRGEPPRSREHERTTRDP